ncbi:MAG: response regulator transcription factor [bacterium]|nr:MAG: response regulator transcription factor [bacterium]
MSEQNNQQKDNLLRESKILLVEDEESLAVGLEYNFSEEGYHVTIARDGKEALVLLDQHDYDLIILDIMLPIYDGFEVARKIREKSLQIPILILTARNAAEDVVEGLEIGADDYITKPFHLKELLLRVKRMLKRKRWYRTIIPNYRFGNNKINFENLKAKSGDRQIQLTKREAMVLKYLIEHQGKIISREELLEKVWGLNSAIETRTVDNFIARLRKYFEPNPSKPIFIKSYRSVGYMFIDSKNFNEI